MDLGEVEPDAERREKSSESRQKEVMPKEETQVAAVMNFDVFLCHRGPGVKGAFVAHLYQAREAERFNPFL